MKKVLLGLLALSAVTMAKPSDLTQAPAAGGTVFEATQEGAIGMTGSLTSTIPTVKYVIYASKDNGTTKEDVLQLTDFILTQDVKKVGFVGINPKVYVKRVVSTGGGETYGELDPSERLELKVISNDFPGLATLNWREEISMGITSFMNKVEVEKIIAGNSILNGFTVDDMGRIGTQKELYNVRKALAIRNLGSGEIIVDTSSVMGGSHLPIEKITAFEDGFKAGIPMGDVKLQIRIK